MKNRKTFKYPGKPAAVDGNTAVILCERESTDAAGAYPITPSTQMGEYWAEAAAKGHMNISGRPLIFVEPEGEHAAAAVTAGFAMTGMRASNFSSGQGVAYMHESLYAAVGKRLTYVLNIGARALTKATLNVHAGHDDYHCIDDTGFFQLFAKNGQSVADLNIIAHRIAELALTPGAVAQDGFLTTHLIESILIPERELIAEYLGRPEDMIDTPTPAQRLIYGDVRRRIPELWDVDNSVMSGLVQNQDSYMQAVAAQRPFFFEHIKEIAEQAFDEFYTLTGRRYEPVKGYRTDDAEYLILGQGSMIPTAEAVADYMREERGIKLGVIDLVMFRPFPAELLSHLIKGKRAVAILERLDQPLAVDLPLMREVRATISRCVENGQSSARKAFPDLASYSISEIPALYSGSFGMGSRDLQPEGLIGVVENMLPDGAQKKFFYLSIDFLHENPISPKRQIYQESIEAAYPEVRELAIRGSENPNLQPPDSITVRFHSVGGWGAITTGKTLAITLYELLGFHIKANPKYGSEKKGQPTTYYLSAAPEPLRVNCEYIYVDVVLAPDPNVFKHTNAIAGLKEHGVFVIQSDLGSVEAVWESIPEPYRRIFVDKKIKLYCLDAFKIAREEASDPDLRLRMQGIAFQGAFFAASPLMQQQSLSEKDLIQSIEAQLRKKFGSKGERIVQENLRVVKRGFDEVVLVPHGPVETPYNNGKSRINEPTLPPVLKKIPQSDSAVTDIHRFWEQTGSFYVRGMGTDTITDPFIGLGVMPAGSSLFRDMTGIRFQHPQWIAENCTACGSCYTVCPDTAIPGLVNEIGQVLDTVVQRIKKNNNDIKHLPRAIRQMENHVRSISVQAKETDNFAGIIDAAIEKTISSSEVDDPTSAEMTREFDMFREELNGFQFALTRPYFTNREKDSPGEGGLLSITVDPNACKGCMECIQVCDDDALRPIQQTNETIETLREHWDFWTDLPNTPEKFIQVNDLDEGIGALHSILLDKKNYSALSSGDGACLGCGEKSAVHLFTATVEAVMQPRIKRHVEQLDSLIEKLEKHIQLKLVEEIDVSDTESMTSAMRGSGDVTLAKIAKHVEKRTGGDPIDRQWLENVSGLLAKLKDLKWKYQQGTTGRGRASMGMLNATGCSSVWGSTFPFNPYPFPWSNHLFQDSASVALGVFEGHMSKMAEGFKAIRMAELELSGEYTPSKHDEFFKYFNWRQFTDEEWELCPPVVAMGGDGAMYDIGFQNLSRLMMSGKPIKVVILDTQVYSNTGGQACTAGFFGQISDMAQFGNAIKGKQEIRKEIGLIAMAHRTTYVLQSTISNPHHMIEGFVRGLRARRPALFSLYTACQPEHGIGDDMSARQSKLAVESRAFPLFRYDPDAGNLPQECFDLDGNPAPDQVWPSYTLQYVENGNEKSMDIPMTFADFAITEIRFRKHFRIAPPETWNEKMIPLAEFLDLEDDEREGRFPFVWSVDRKRNLSRLLVAQPIVESCEDRRHFWNMLCAMAKSDETTTDRTEIESEVRKELSSKLAAGIMKLAMGNEAQMPFPEIESLALAGSSEVLPSNSESADLNQLPLAPWIESEQCTACDECIKLNPKIFEYNDAKKAVIKNPNGGPYRDLVKAAERCTARVIHPGLPRDRAEKDIEKWIERGSKYN